MLLRPFKFAELKKPLQKLTVLYAYSEKPIINMVLSEKGEEDLKVLNSYWSNGGALSFFNHDKMYSKRFGETIEEYDERMGRYLDDIFRLQCTKEDYKGEIVQCYVEGQLCRFYPEEYKVIGRDTFDHLLTCDEHEYKLEVENPSYYQMKDIKSKIFYIRNRGISETKAMKMSSNEAKDNAIFRPQQALLEYFCRPQEIY